MDLKVGEHCAFSPCHQLDFLPVKCPGCELLFCTDHSKPADHGCEHAERLERGVVVPECPVCGALIDASRGEDPNAKVDAHIASGCARHVKTDVKAGSGGSAKHKCELAGCGGSEFQRIPCSRCGRNFCLKHRFPAEHKCTVAENKQSSASGSGGGNKKGSKGGASSSSSSAGQQPQRKKKLLRTKVILKQPPVGADKIGDQLRVTFPVYFPSESDLPPVHMAFNRNWTVGKAIDVVASQGRIRNENNVPGAEPLRLFSLKTRQMLPTSEKLQSLVPGLLSREGMVLERGEELRDDYVTKDDTSSKCAIS